MQVRRSVTRPGTRGVPVAFEAHGRDGVVYLRGELDVSTEPEARSIVLVEAGRGLSLTLDMSKLTFCDSTGLKLVMQALLALRKGGRLRVVGANRYLRKLLEISGLGRHPAVLVEGPSAIPPGGVA
jgi:anti-sigma B factor antagonist